MATERATIKLDVDADTRELDKVTRKILGVAAASKAADDDVDSLDKKFRIFGRTIDDNNKKLDDTGKKLKRAGKAASGFEKILKTGFKYAMLGSAIETAGLAIALSSVNGLLATGRFLVKSYQVAMSGLAKGAAVAGAALATVAAAQRQFIAAQATGRYGGSFAAASAGLRTMQSDARLASTGMKTLSSAFAAASKNARVTGGTSSAIAGLLDFAYAAGDVEKGTAALASFISLIQKGEAVGGSKVMAAATEIGPEFEKQYKEILKGGKVTSEELFKMFSSGEFAKKAGISGSAAAVEGSLLGQFKRFITTMQVMFADLGTQFIVPFQEAFSEVERILRRTTIAIGPIIAEYTTGTLVDKLVNGIDKLSKFLVTLMREYVPMVTGFFAKLAEFWNRIKDGFSAFGRYLNQFKEGSRIINRFFGGILRAIGRGLKGNFEDFSQQVVDNQDNLLSWGERIEGFIDSIFKLFRSIRNAFFDALPVFERLLGIVTSIVNAISGLVNVLSSLGPLGATLGYLAPMAGMTLLTSGGRQRAGRMVRGARNRIQNITPMQATIGAAMVAQLATNQMPAFFETAGDIGTGALIGGSAVKYGMGGIQNLATRAFDAGAVLQAGGGRAATMGGQVMSGATNIVGASSASLVGAGATAAATAVASYVFSNMVSDALARATDGNTAATYAGGILTGAATGGAGGAAAGFMVAGPPGAVVGAIVMSVVGAIAGAFTAWRNDSKYKKQADTAAKRFVEGYTDIMSTALGQNNIEAFRQMVNDYEKYREQVVNSQVKKDRTRNKIDELYTETLNNELIPIAAMMEARLKDLNRVTGKTEDEIIAMANAAEINLGNGMMNLQQIMEATGVATVRFGQTFRESLADIYAEAVSGFRTTTDILNAPSILNENAQALREKILSGAAPTPEDIGAFLETQYSQALLVNQGDPIKAARYMAANLGYMEDGTFVPGKQFELNQLQLAGMMPTGPLTSELFGVDFAKALQEAGIGQFLSAYQTQFSGGAASLIAQNVYGQLAGFGLLPSTTIDQFTNILGDQDPMKLLALAELVSDPDFLAGDYGGAISNLLSGDSLLAKLIPADMADQLTKMNTTSQEGAQEFLRTILGTELFESLGNFGTTAEKGLERVAVAFEEGSPMLTAMTKFNENIQLLIDAVSDGDTATPRANTLRTLGTHAQFDAMIAGKRTVTSSYRTGRLGSMNSDHANGLAYDLTGQNLGMYGQAIRGAGGFAEFHGNGRGRHLHVVPNPAMGDTAMPLSNRSVFIPTQQSSNSLTVVVNAQPGMDVNAVAREVISQYEKMQKSRNERY